MCSTVLAQSRPARKARRAAALISAVGILGTAWGCRVKRVDPSGPAPPASVAAPAPSSSIAAVASVKPPVAAARTPITAPAPKPAAPPAPEPSLPEPESAAELPAFAASDLPPGVAAAAFAGPGIDPTQTPGLVNAVRHALRAFTHESSPLEAAVAGATILEDDPLLNARAGAALRIDGSAELEVLVMDSSGHLGAAAAVRNVRHPVRVAFAAASSPHRLLVGEGAQRVAKWLGLPAYDVRTPRQTQTYESLVAGFAPGQPQRADATAWGSGVPGPGSSAWQAYLEPPRTAPPPAPAPADAGADAAPPVTEPPPAESSAAAVALLVRAGPGAFAGAIETGGTWLALPGSVGAIATPGAALHVAGRGAVALAGPSEHLIAGALARRTYDKLLAYQSARAAAAWALEQAAGRPISIVVMDARNIVTLSNAQTAWAKADPNESSSAPSAAEGPPR